MYKIKDTLKRAGSFAGAAGFLATLSIMLVPPGAISADALNPLTDRSLTLSSSSPGWDYLDGSGNSTYAPPGSGGNGQKTGETFQFDVSTDSYSEDTGHGPAISGLSLQYCTAAAGQCIAPGNDGYVGTSGSYTADNPDSSTTTNLNVVDGTGDNLPTEMSSATYTADFDTSTGGLNPTVLDTSSADTTNNAPITDPLEQDIASNSLGNFIVLTKDVGDSTWTYSPDWTMTSSTNDDTGTIAAGTATSDNNYIQLLNSDPSSGALQLHTGGAVKVIFFGTDDNYITNPGAGAFFVKINDYGDTANDLTDSDLYPYATDGTASATGNQNDASPDLVDGGVTVANVMNQSIEIQTRVLETMDFSVGTVDPDTLSSTYDTTADSVDSPLGVASGGKESAHGTCDPILNSLDPTSDAANTLLLGDPNAENSLSTQNTYGTYSFFRLSSNSSAGATVYYSGTSLNDTEGNTIQPIGTTAAAPHPGTEQFGLALDNENASGSTNYPVSYSDNDPSYIQSADGGATAVDSTFATDTSADSDVHDPQLYPLVPETGYGGGTGYIDTETSGSGENAVTNNPNTDFAFDPNSVSIPAALAAENSQVVDCVTGKVMYIANIAATTPADIYTTEVNYIASPEY